MSFIISSVRKAVHSAKRIFQPPIRVAEGQGRKRALICYITHPFRTKKHDYRHSNKIDSRAIAKVLSELGYDVWAIDFDSDYPVDYSRYELLIGFGRAFERSFDRTFCGKRVFYLTGASPCFSNWAEVERLRSVRARKGTLLKPRRTVQEPWVASAMLSDAVACIGNDWTRSTYASLGVSPTMIPAPYVSSWDRDSLKKDFRVCRSNFVWFGSLGAVHKGLDLALEAMETVDGDHMLEVCGDVEKESDFFELYRDHLLGRNNITYHGFMDVRSNEMKLILEQCGFVILPSCSEGTATSVLTMMDAGLIPIVTRESGIDIEDFGLLIQEFSPESVALAMEKAASLPSEEIRERSERVSRFTRENHSVEALEAKLREIFLSVDQ